MAVVVRSNTMRGAVPRSASSGAAPCGVGGDPLIGPVPLWAPDGRLRRAPSRRRGGRSPPAYETLLHDREPPARWRATARDRGAPRGLCVPIRLAPHRNRRRECPRTAAGIVRCSAGSPAERRRTSPLRRYGRSATRTLPATRRDTPARIARD